MPAELGRDRRGADLPRLEREGRRREGLHHRRAREIAEVAALRSRRAGGMLLRQIVEILPTLQRLDHRLALFGALHQDMARTDPGRTFLVGHGLVVDQAPAVPPPPAAALPGDINRALK